MNELKKNFPKGDDGFSLMELVVGVAIMLIMTVIGTVSYAGVMNETRQAAVESAAETVMTGSIAYTVDEDSSTDPKNAEKQFNKTSTKGVSTKLVVDGECLNVKAVMAGHKNTAERFAGKCAKTETPVTPVPTTPVVPVPTTPVVPEPTTPAPTTPAPTPEWTPPPRPQPIPDSSANLVTDLKVTVGGPAFKSAKVTFKNLELNDPLGYSYSPSLATTDVPPFTLPSSGTPAWREFRYTESVRGTPFWDAKNAVPADAKMTVVVVFADGSTKTFTKTFTASEMKLDRSDSRNRYYVLKDNWAVGANGFERY